MKKQKDELWIVNTLTGNMMRIYSNSIRQGIQVVVEYVQAWKMWGTDYMGMLVNKAKATCMAKPATLF